MTQIFELPRLRDLARHAVPEIVEVSLVPVVVFYSALRLVGVWGALLASLAWCYVALARRLLRRRPVPGLLLISALGLTARTIIAFASGSVFVYFLQPTLTTVVIAGVFLASVPAGRPLAQRLASDMFPLPEALLARPAVRRVFERITLLWGAINIVNAGVTIVLLATQPVGTFVLLKTALSFGVMAGGIALSTVWFRRAVRPGAV